MPKIGMPLIVLVMCSAAWSQAPLPEAEPLKDEPHHQLLLENPALRVFRLELNAGEATISHRHPGSYAFIVLHGGDLSNEVKGRPPVRTSLSDGEFHTSKGGFALVEHNTGQSPIELIVIEPTAQELAKTQAFEDPIAGFRYHDAVLGTLFERPPLRAYEMTLASGGRTEPHLERYDRLLVALTDVHLQDKVEGKADIELGVSAGGVSWLPGGSSDRFMNVGDQPGHFIIVDVR